MVAGMHTQTAAFISGVDAPARVPTENGGLLGEPFLSHRLFTADDVAAILGVPRTFVYSLARRGELPTVRVGERYVRFRAHALEGWIAAQESTRPKGTQ